MNTAEIKAELEKIRQRQADRKAFVDTCRRVLEQKRQDAGVPLLSKTTESADQIDVKRATEAYYRRRDARLAIRGLKFDRVNGKLIVLNTDEDIWRTTENGEHFLLGESGEIKAGFGGKFTGKKPGEAFGKGRQKQESSTTAQKQQSTNAKQSSNTHPTSQSTAESVASVSNSRSGHLTASDYFGENASLEDSTKKLARDLSNNLGRDISPKEADQMWDSTLDYSGSGYTRVRQAFSDPDNATQDSIRQLKQIDELIAGSPKWGEGQLYRGVNVDNAVLSSWTLGETINMRGPSSWSSEQSQANSFMRGDGNRVMFSLPSTNQAASITHLSNFPHEKEVLAPSSSQYTIKAVNKKKVKGKIVYFIDLEEN